MYPVVTARCTARPFSMQNTYSCSPRWQTASCGTTTASGWCSVNILTDAEYPGRSPSVSPRRDKTVSTVASPLCPVRLIARTATGATLSTCAAYTSSPAAAAVTFARCPAASSPAYSSGDCARTCRLSRSATRMQGSPAITVSPADGMVSTVPETGARRTLCSAADTVCAACPATAFHTACMRSVPLSCCASVSVHSTSPCSTVSPTDAYTAATAAFSSGQSAVLSTASTVPVMVTLL